MSPICDCDQGGGRGTGGGKAPPLRPDLARRTRVGGRSSTTEPRVRPGSLALEVVERAEPARSVGVHARPGGEANPGEAHVRLAHQPSRAGGARDPGRTRRRRQVRFGGHLQPLPFRVRLRHVVHFAAPRPDPSLSVRMTRGDQEAGSFRWACYLFAIAGEGGARGAGGGKAPPLRPDLARPTRVRAPSSTTDPGSGRGLSRWRRLSEPSRHARWECTPAPAAKRIQARPTSGSPTSRAVPEAREPPAGPVGAGNPI